jgi:hypothetical protein
MITNIVSRGIFKVKSLCRLCQKILYHASETLAKYEVWLLTWEFSSTTDTMALSIPSLHAINCISAVKVLLGLEIAVDDIAETAAPAAFLSPGTGTSSSSSVVIANLTDPLLLGYT